MDRFFLNGVAAAAFTFLAGCSGINGTEVATFSAEMSGEFDDSGTHSAAIVFLADVNESTFKGRIDNFKFSRRGFDGPSGSIPISGILSYGQDGNVKFKGTGEGTLSQAGLQYDVSIELESGWVHPRLDAVSMFYFGGGELKRSGRYLDWVGMKGDFRAEADCKTGRIGSVQCELPTLSRAEEEPT